MLIETKRLTVRTFREEDADALYRIKTDPQVTEFCPDFLDVCADRTDMQRYIRTFQQIEDTGDTDAWRCYAIESKDTGEVVGALTFCKQNMLHEYDLGWMMISAYTGKGFASEAAEAFAEFFCRTNGVDYLTAVMFRLFEKRTIYDYHYNRYADDYFYFRRYWSGCTLKDRYYGDSPYNGRSTSDRKEEPYS